MNNDDRTIGGVLSRRSALTLMGAGYTGSFNVALTGV